MQRKRFESWLKNIYETRDEEISCTECFELVSPYVELEIAGADVSAKMPHVKHHLSQCAACREEYEALRDLRRMEEDGDLPSSDDLQDLI